MGVPSVHSVHAMLNGIGLMSPALPSKGVEEAVKGQKRMSFCSDVG